MVRWLLMIMVVVAGAGYYFFYPPVVLGRATEQALSELAAAVDAQDRPRVSEILNRYLAPTAEISLTVNMPSLTLTQDQAAKTLSQNFDKGLFVMFIDNTLFALSDYNYRAQIQQFHLGDKHNTAVLSFTSREWADGTSYYGGTAVKARFSSDTSCDAELSFKGDKLAVNKLVCTETLRTVPKPEEALKLENPAALKDLLR